jgi:diadenosine tetraphosphatase ApaH/serine/threonine PP2A family protein phosphatase
VEPGYDGVRLHFPLRRSEVLSMLDLFKKGKSLHYRYVAQMLVHFKKSEVKTPTVQHITINDGEKFTVVGDLHGQLQDLFTIFTINGLPSPTNRYLFNGDFVDRGMMGVEVFLTLLAFYFLCPGCVFFNRGNHEARAQTSWMGFEEEVLEKYSSQSDTGAARRLYNLFMSCFDVLPLVAVVQEKVFVCHGGLFRMDGVTLKHIDAIRRRREPPLEGTSLEDKIYEDLIWSDPRPTGTYPQRIMGRRPSDRGAGVEFGPDVTNQFCVDNSIALVLRSHECVQEGYEVLHDGRLITIFSASRYCGTQTNKGAFITFGPDLQPEIQQVRVNQLRLLICFD